MNKLLIPPKKIKIKKGIFNLTDSAILKFYYDQAISNPEGYKIEILTDGIKICSATEAGSFYAIQTIKELSRVYNNKLPCCEINDEPDFARRGVYLDCSRGKVPKISTIKQLAERLAQWKINELQLYIENVFTFKKHPEIGRGYSPFTPEEILDLQSHCKKYHIRLVGSLASFGHMEKILAIPKYRHLAELPGYRGFPGGMTLCPADPKSIKFVDELYSEFVPLFEAEDFNACCDETFELGEGRSANIAVRIGKGRLYLDFLLKIYQLCQKYGKRMNVWADIVLKYPELLNKLPKDIVMLNWWYEAEGENIVRTKDIAESGLPFMVCPGTSSWQTHGTRLANSIANAANFARQGRKYGAEGLLNTDWGDAGHRNMLGVSMHGFAHGAAQSWNGRAVDNEKFTENFCLHYFGQNDNKLAKAIKQLGSNYLTCGHIAMNRCMLYHALVEPLKYADDGYMFSFSEKGLRKIAESNLNFRGFVNNSMDAFEKIAIEELELAAKMDKLAAARVLAIRQKNYQALKDLKKPMSEMSDEFKRLWLTRNKLSRLNDNLKLMKNAAAENCTN